MSRKILGLVLELNPFHLGHHYFINKAKQVSEADLVIAVISSSFTMRGEAMILDKFSKAKILLDHGVNLVMELPFLSGVTSSDYFTFNAIKILANMGITDFAFGSELDNIDDLHLMNKLTASKSFNTQIKSYLQAGFSYPTSAYKALQSLTDDLHILSNYPLPNNTLGMGYLKAIMQINPAINPHLVKRIDNQYYDSNLQINKFNSATALREALNNDLDICNFLPSYQANLYKPNTINQNIFRILQYQLLKIDDYQNIWGIKEGIEKRLINLISDFSTLEQFISHAQTKRYPRNRIQRLIIHLLLETPKDYENCETIYLRILSMDLKAQKYLSTLTKEIKQQIITTFKNSLNPLVKFELKVTKLWGLLTNNPLIYLEEYKIPYRKDENI